MGNEGREYIEALRQAIPMEQMGYEFYEKLGNTTEDPNAKKLFEHLREEEVDHLRRVRGQLEKVLGQRERTRVLAEEALKEGPFEGWWVFPEEGDAAVGERTQELKALEVAIAAEKRSKAFYDEWAQKAADPEGREMYRWLAEMEHEHVRLLQWELDGLTDSGHWFDIAEFDMEG